MCLLVKGIRYTSSRGLGGARGGNPSHRIRAFSTLHINRACLASLWPGTRLSCPTSLSDHDAATRNQLGWCSSRRASKCGAPLQPGLVTAAYPPHLQVRLACGGGGRGESRGLGVSGVGSTRGGGRLPRRARVGLGGKDAFFWASKAPRLSASDVSRVGSHARSALLCCDGWTMTSRAEPSPQKDSRGLAGQGAIKVTPTMPRRGTRSCCLSCVCAASPSFRFREKRLEL